MQKRKKKKHPEMFVGKHVEWRWAATQELARELAEGGESFVGTVIDQELILQVRLHKGEVVAVDSRLVRVVENPDAR